MIIAITQRDQIISDMEFSFDTLERSWYYFLNKHTLVPVPNMGHDFDYDNFKFDCLVITGGPDSHARNLTENILFAYAVKNHKPVVGICHGAFAVNDLTGGVNGNIENHWKTEHGIIMENERYIVNSYHGQSIQSIGKNMEVIALDDDDNIEAFKHKSEEIYGIVWHPERMKNPVLPKKLVDFLL